MDEATCVTSRGTVLDKTLFYDVYDESYHFKYATPSYNV